MDFFQTIHERQSIRAFEPREVEPAKLQDILNAACAAPSAGNVQALQIHVVRSHERQRELAQAAYGQEFLAQAPVLLVFCADPIRSAAKYKARGERLYSVQDATIAAAYAQLAATAVGLATCWIGAFDEEAVTRVAGLPAGQRPVVLLPLGYAAEKPPPTSRRPLRELVQELG